MRHRQFLSRSFTELTGTLHVHTQYSHDCDMPMKRIIQSARSARLDFLGLTDHMNTHAADDPHIKNTGNLIVMVGFEVNDSQTDNHYLVFGTAHITSHSEAEDYVREYNSLGATGFIAHPLERRLTKKYRMYPWTAPLMREVDGIEVWNYISSWLGGLSEVLNGLIYVLFPMYFVRRPWRENLDLWDEMNRRGWRKPAIGSVDAHAHRKKFLGIKFRVLPHGYLFRTIRTNVLLHEDEERNEANILRALREGRSYIVNNQIGTPHNFWAGVWSPTGASACFGEEIPFTPGARFYYHLPAMGNIRLFRNGERIDRRRDDSGFFELTSPGFYRLEIRRWNYGWIYTNNIWVTPQANDNA